MSEVRLGSTSVYFNSICFTLAATVFMILIMIMYFSKNKVKSSSSTLFMITVYLNISTLIMEYLLPIAVKHIIDLNGGSIYDNLICRIYMVLVVMWDMFFVIYTTSYIVQNKLVSNENKKKNVLLLSLIFFICLILAIGYVTILKFDYIGGFENHPYTLGGPIRFITDLVTVIGSSYVLFIFTYNKEKIKNINIVSFYILFIIYALAVVLEKLGNYYLNHNALMGSLIMINSYFSIESMDSKLLDEYKKLKDSAEKTNKAKDKFLTSISHKIRTPMNVLMVFCDSLLGNENVTESDFNEDFQNINISRKNIFNLANNISDISKLAYKNEDITAQQYSLDELLLDVYDSVKLLDNKNINVSFDVDRRIPNTYNGDSRKVSKIIYNILLDAMSHTEDGSTFLYVSGNVKEDKKFEFLFDISFTSEGLDNVQDSEFDDYFGDETNEEENKTSLEFIIAKRFIEQLEGNLEVKKGDGKLVTYKITFIQDVVDTLPIQDMFYNKYNLIKDNKNQIDCSDKKVLIFDNDKLNLKLLSRYLERYKFIIEKANNEVDFINLLKDNDYDFVFVDEAVNISKIKLIYQFNKIQPKFVVLKNKNFYTDTDNSFDYFYVGQLNKPIIFSQFERTIKYILYRDKGGDF